MNITILIVIAISLSMDAFSLSLAYGTLNLDKKIMKQLSVIVGCYHFFMPIIGMFIGKVILNFIPLKPNIVVFVVLLFIGLQMLVESFKQEKTLEPMSKIELFLFGLAVSIDSFSVGISLNSITSNYLLAALAFSISACTFTYMGLKLGKKINEIIGKISTVIGGSVLIIIGFIYLLQL